MDKNQFVEEDFERAKNIQEGLSIVKFTKIDNVLLVEGKTDAVFYMNFSEKKIFFGTPEEKESIKEIIKEKRKGEKHVYGIIDRDYQMPCIEEQLKDYLFITDANSLETMIIKYVGIDDFEEIIKKRIFFKYKGSIENHLTNDALEWAFIIGCLRNENSKNDMHLPFSNTIKNHDFFRAYLKKGDGGKFVFKDDIFLENLIEKSKLSLNEAKRYIEKYNKDKDLWNICRGHDIFDFIDAIIRSISMAPRNIKTIIPKWEYDLIEKKNKKKLINKIKPKFDNSELKKWFDKINSEKPPITSI